MVLQKLLFYLEEDIAGGDITSDAIIPDVSTNARIIAKEDGVIAGLFEAVSLFNYYGVETELKKHDSEKVRSGDVLIEISGSAGKILLLERTVLNIIGRMSGVSTRTNQLSSVIKEINPLANVSGTRKTSPGFREFDKKAIILGGGDPHRYNLSDGFLIKDNHLALCSIKEAVKLAKDYTAYKKVEIEVESVFDAVKAAEAGADIILLDNMTPERIKEVILALEEKGLRKSVILEASGGILGDLVLEYAKTGVDRISLGELTHSVKNLDVSLEIMPALKTLKIS
ncbi:carboxylating nicotinate-nucleotide diphosphorylase [Methanomicrobium antiquum]|uniref:Nicotinate-nucleotide pyrophosphorylase [carboxylating] n=1 Tax=Methanomicrobium antiquum TaxID=487686 RepID=A0AAF0FQI2_9EURY|nr:carboxylating nicotinate-nucleotide diphosphorylase [Methanomicrobium antiquum]WFN36737.1 carboxylating nicotinate-nucleotide diphosphorylase [Methanomicrobium antiquum]